LYNSTRANNYMRKSGGLRCMSPCFAAA